MASRFSVLAISLYFFLKKRQHDPILQDSEQRAIRPRSPFFEHLMYFNDCFFPTRAFVFHGLSVPALNFVSVIWFCISISGHDCTIY